MVKKTQNLVKVVCAQPPMTRFTNQPNFFETKQNNWSYVTMIHFIKNIENEYVHSCIEVT